LGDFCQFLGGKSGKRHFETTLGVPLLDLLQRDRPNVVVPGDKHGGRHVDAVDRISLVEVKAP
jgi:hypothetical protein